MISSQMPAAYVAGTGFASPTNRVSQADAIDALQRMFPDEDPQAVRSMVRRSGVDQRFIVPTLDQMLEDSTFTERNAQYCEAAGELAARACREAIEQADIRPEEVDTIIDVSCTGLSLPALDVGLVQSLGLSPNTCRIPIAESGCAAGALAVNLATGLARAGQTVLIAAVELCTLSFCCEDRTRTNLVASIIFGDGASSAVITPQPAGSRSARIEQVRSVLIDQTQDLMGFHFGTHGMRLILDKELPGLVSSSLNDVIDGLLATQGWERSTLDYHLIHPGGRAILDAYQSTLGLEPEALRFSREVLSSCGNMSSASILAVLRLALREIETTGRGGRGLLLAIGPGISFETALLTFEGAS